MRLRVKRAAELGLPYKTDASVRASTGEDLIGFLSSSHALRLRRTDDAIPPDRAQQLGALVRLKTLALVHRPLTPDAALHSGLIDHARPAPTPWDSRSEMRDMVVILIAEATGPSDRYLVIGETAFERAWAEAAKTAGFLSDTRFFGAATAQ